MGFTFLVLKNPKLKKEGKNEAKKGVDSRFRGNDRSLRNDCALENDRSLGNDCDFIKSGGRFVYRKKEFFYF